MNCTICQNPITLSPSATDRAKKFGGTPSYYTALFQQHSQCVIDKRNGLTDEQIKARRYSDMKLR